MTLTAQLQTSPYLREQRQFPFENVSDLAGQIDQAYIDIANKVNTRTIGIYATNFPVITGDSWFLNGQPQRQQSLRKVFPVTGIGNIAHNLNLAAITQFTANTYGSYVDSLGNWSGLLYASTVAIPGQNTFYIDSTNIVVLAGAGAPIISTGTIIIEWISQF